MTCRATIYAILTLIFLTKALAPSHVKAENTSSFNLLVSSIQTAIRHAGPTASESGIYVSSLSDDHVVFRHNSNRQYIVASNAKLLTTAAALVRLGPDFTFRTTLYSNGDTNDGTLHGDLVLQGNGDPSLSGRFFNGNSLLIPQQWVEAIKRAGINRISGDIIVDDSAFDRHYVHNDWPQAQLSRWYCSQVSALSFNDNCLDILVLPGHAVGRPAQIAASPLTSYVRLLNKCRTTTGNRNISVHRDHGSNVITVSGKCPLGSEPTQISATIHAPPLFLGTILAERLQANRIPFEGHVRFQNGYDEPLKPLTVVATTTSHLKDAIRIANSRSQNFYAEQIFKALGAKDAGNGSFRSGAIAVTDFLISIGLPKNSLTVADGCGLSRQNRYSPRQIVAVLTYMYGHQYSETFINSLAAGGSPNGSLRNRFQKHCLRRQLRAKTGSLSGVSTLSGYVIRPNGNSYAFSILSNSGSTARSRRMQDAIVEALLEHAP